MTWIGEPVNIIGEQEKEESSTFQDMFLDENACIAHLFHIRWPEGFTCPTCSWVANSIKPSRTIVCPHCGNRTSLTADTVMHGTKKPISAWLSAIWWLSDFAGTSSAKDLQRLLKLSSYQTAWTWMQKLRYVMAAADFEPCHGVVEIGSGSVAPAWEKPDRALVVAAVETIFPSGITGRIRMHAMDEFSVEELSGFMAKAVKSGSTIIGPGLKEYLDADKYGSMYVIDNSYVNPARINEIISSFEIWLNKVHRGGVAVKHVQQYLDEFCFRNNSVILPDQEAVFSALLRGCMAGRSKPYRVLVGDQK